MTTHMIKNQFINLWLIILQSLTSLIAHFYFAMLCVISRTVFKFWSIWPCSIYTRQLLTFTQQRCSFSWVLSRFHGVSRSYMAFQVIIFPFSAPEGEITFCSIPYLTFLLWAWPSNMVQISESFSSLFASSSAKWIWLTVILSPMRSASRPPSTTTTLATRSCRVSSSLLVHLVAFAAVYLLHYSISRLQSRNWKSQRLHSLLLCSCSYLYSWVHSA